MRVVQDGLNIWQVFRNDIPDKFEIDPQILMGKHVAQSADLPPRHARRALLKPFAAQALGCLTDDFKISDDRILSFRTGKKRLSSLAGLCLDTLQTEQDVVQENARVAAHSGRASLRIRSRRKGLMLFGVTTSARLPTMASRSCWRPMRSSSEA